MDEKLKSENMQKEQFSMFMLYCERQSRQAGVENGAMLTTYFSDILQNAPFRSQIFNIFFASGGKGALTPLTKILRTFLVESLRRTYTERTFTLQGVLDQKLAQ